MTLCYKLISTLKKWGITALVALAFGVLVAATTPGAALGQDAPSEPINSMDNYVVATTIPPNPVYIHTEIPEGGLYVKLPIDTDPRTMGQCVNYIKWITNAPFSGNAINWKAYINSDVPKIGSIAVFNSSYHPNGHVGIVKDVNYWHNKQYIQSRNGPGGLFIVTIDSFDIYDQDIAGYIDLELYYTLLAQN